MKPNAIYAFRYLQEKHGLAPHQVAGLVGTWVQESGENLNTGARNKGDGRDGSDSVGIAQWNGPRARGLQRFAADRGVSWTDLDTQIDWAMTEMDSGSERQWGKALRNSQDVLGAARAAISYERPAGWTPENQTGGHGWSNRFANAQRLLGATPEQIAAAGSGVSAPMPTDRQGAAPGGMLAPPSGVSSFAQSSAAQSNPAFAAIEADLLKSAFAPAMMPAQNRFGGVQVASNDADDWGAGDTILDDALAPSPFKQMSAQPAPAAPVSMSAPPVDDDWGAGDLKLDDGPAPGVQMATPSADPRKTKPVEGSEAPWAIRMQVGALEKPEDRLAALRKFYPDAQPTGSDNFVFTDPTTGKVNSYRQEGWLRVPSVADVASIASELGEAAGGMLGAGAAVGLGAGTGGAGLVTVPAAAGAGAVAGREYVQQAMNWLAGNQDTRTTPERINAMGMTFAGNAAGEALGAGINQGIRAVADNALGRAPGEAAARIADFQSATGVSPTPGMVARLPGQAVAEQAAASLPGTGARIQGRIDDAFRGLEAGFGRVVGDMRTRTNVAAQPTTTQEMGGLLRQQAEEAQQQFRDRQGQLYGQAYQAIGPGPAAGQNVTALAGQLGTELDGLGRHARMTIGPQLEGIIGQARAISEDIGAGANFDQLLNSRKAIGDALGALQNAGTSTARAERDYLNRLYSAITDDLDATAQAAGGDALSAWRKANNHTRRAVSQDSPTAFRNSIDPIVDADTDEAVWRFATQGTKDGGTRLRAIRREIVKSGGQETWDRFGATVIERLGTKVNPGTDTPVFDAASFMRGWRGLSREAKDQLFAGSDRAAYRAELDRLARVTESLQKYRRSDNHSGTNKASIATRLLTPFATGSTGGGLVGFATGGPSGSASGAAIGAAIGAAATAGNFVIREVHARLVTDPRFVRWLARAPAAEMERGGIRAHLREAGRLFNNTPSRALVAEYFRSIGLGSEADELFPSDR